MIQNKENLKKSLFYFQKMIKASMPALTASYGLIGSIVVFTFIGYLSDHWLGSSPWLMILGILFGMGVGFYDLSKFIWKG